MRTLEQRRAADALSCVEKLHAQNDEFKMNYRSYVSSLGPAIVMNGLGQALATERAAGAGDRASERAHRRLYDNLQAWLCGQGGQVYPDHADLLRAIVENDEARYLLAQAEALAWLDWHKKFCRAELPSGGGE